MSKVNPTYKDNVSEYLCLELRKSLFGHEIFSDEEQIRHYRIKYEVYKNIDVTYAMDGLKKSIAYQVLKIRKDHSL